jgi:iron-sulfur cluster repair protein YtfE (RIC family)
MLVQLGTRTTTQDFVDLLYECHGRIHKFLAFATELATSIDLPAAEAKEVASQIHRYFAVSFPLHLADEDESITPALANDATTRAALARMHADHAAHDHLVARLVTLAAAIERDPACLATVRAELRAAAGALTAALEPHLVLEEHVIFPALRRLPQSMRDDLRAAMQARREQVLSITS